MTDIFVLLSLILKVKFHIPSVSLIQLIETMYSICRLMFESRTPYFFHILNVWVTTTKPFDTTQLRHSKKWKLFGSKRGSWWFIDDDENGSGDVFGFSNYFAPLFTLDYEKESYWIGSMIFDHLKERCYECFFRDVNICQM